MSEDEWRGDDAQRYDDERRRHDLMLGRAFTPAAPVTRADLFAGRTAQVRDALDVLFQPGQHAVIYGERGVGKTSLTTVLAEIMGGGQLLALRTNCDGTDTFTSIWNKVLEEVRMTETVAGFGFRAEMREIARSVTDLFPPEGPVTPNDVRKVLHLLGTAQTTAVIIDEFDRLDDEPTRTLFADTIKMLSDHLVPTTVILVGVADNVDELIAEHHSVERALVQIHMPRMSAGELTEIVQRGLRAVEMEIEANALTKITRLSLGLPHYTHLLSQWAARAAVTDGRHTIQPPDVESAIGSALDRAQESIVNAYHRATFSPRENLYQPVILAAALAPQDDLGYFTAPGVRTPLREIMGKPYEIPAFARHLNALTEGERGPILQKTGVPRRFRYRFINPLLQPYVMMRGLASGMLEPEMLDRLMR